MIGSAFFSMVHVRGVLIPFKGVFFISWRKSYSFGVEMKPLLPNLLAELALYSSEDNVSFILIFPDQTIMTQSENGAASESDVTSLGMGQELNFDDDTLKGKDSYNF